MNDYRGTHSFGCKCDACQPYVPSDKYVVGYERFALPFAIIAGVLLWTLIGGVVIHWLSR